MNLKFPIDEIRRHLVAWGCDIFDTKSGIAWENQWGHSQISITARSATTVDGSKLVGIVSYIHMFGATAAAQLDAKRAAGWNQLASLSAIMPRREDGHFCLVSRATLYAGDDDAWARIYAPIICTEAYIQPAAIFLSNRWDAVGPEYFGLSNGSAPPPYGNADFEIARQHCQERGLYATADENGITVEFPWDRGAVSAGFAAFAGAIENSAEHGRWLKLGGNTFLCQVQTSVTHPCLGRGLLCTLQTPVTFGNEAILVDAVSALNQWEASATDMVPLFGAWCRDPAMPSPAFVMFIPNELCFRNMPSLVVTWMGHRAFRTLPLLATWYDTGQYEGVLP